MPVPIAQICEYQRLGLPNQANTRTSDAWRLASNILFCSTKVQTGVGVVSQHMLCHLRQDVGYVRTYIASVTLALGHNKLSDWRQ